MALDKQRLISGFCKIPGLTLNRQQNKQLYGAYEYGVIRITLSTDETEVQSVHIHFPNTIDKRNYQTLIGVLFANILPDEAPRRDYPQEIYDSVESGTLFDEEIAGLRVRMEVVGNQINLAVLPSLAGATGGDGAS